LVAQIKVDQVAAKFKSKYCSLNFNDEAFSDETLATRILFNLKNQVSFAPSTSTMKLLAMKL